MFQQTYLNFTLRLFNLVQKVQSIRMNLKYKIFLLIHKIFKNIDNIITKKKVSFQRNLSPIKKMIATL